MVYGLVGPVDAARRDEAGLASGVMDAASQRLQEITGRLARGELDAAGFLEAFCRFLTDHVGCNCAGIWLFGDSERGRTLRCIALYDRRADAMVDAGDLVVGEVAAYFEHLLRNGIIVASDARRHPATAGFLEGYLLPRDVHSRLDTCIAINGRLRGTFCCEQTGAPTEWSPQQIGALRSVAARASLSLLKAFDNAYDTAPAPLWDSSSPQSLLTRPQDLDPH
jgi:GAF domain-containing protein